MKSLRGDKDEGVLAKLTRIHTAGMAATRLSESYMANDRLSGSTIIQWRDDIEILIKAGHTITENIARRWCCGFAEICLTKDVKNTFVECLRIWLLPGETRHRIGG